MSGKKKEKEVEQVSFLSLFDYERKHPSNEQFTVQVVGGHNAPAPYRMTPMVVDPDNPGGLKPLPVYHNHKDHYDSQPSEFDIKRELSEYILLGSLFHDPLFFVFTSEKNQNPAFIYSIHANPEYGKEVTDE